MSGSIVGRLSVLVVICTLASRSCESGVDQASIGLPIENVESDGANIDVKHIVEILQDAQIDEVLKGLPVHTSPPAGEGQEFVVLQLQSKENIAADGVRRWVIVNPANMVFWIKTSGGYLGVTQWHGPATVRADHIIVPND